MQVLDCASNAIFLIPGWNHHAEQFETVTHNDLT
jgi:hypothetical protein